MKGKLRAERQLINKWHSVLVLHGMNQQEPLLSLVEEGLSDKEAA